MLTISCVYFTICALCQEFSVIFVEHFSLLTIWLHISLFCLAHMGFAEKSKIAWQLQTSRSLKVIM